LARVALKAELHLINL